jgi:hypothetical protein
MAASRSASAVAEAATRRTSRRRVARTSTRKSEREIGVEVPFVALIEDDGAHAGKVRIVLKPLDEQPGGDDFDAGARASTPLPAYRVADRGVDLLADQRRHPARRVSCGDPPRLGDNDPAAQPPSEGKGQQGGLARAGRRTSTAAPRRSTSSSSAGRTVRTGRAGRLNRSGRSFASESAGTDPVSRTARQRRTSTMR